MEAKELHPSSQEDNQNKITPESIDKTERTETNEETNNIEKAEEEKPDNAIIDVDFDSMGRHDIIAKLNDIINNNPINRIKDIVDKGVKSFNAKYNADFDAKKSKFLEEGGLEEDFDFNDDSKEQLNLLMKTYREKKFEYSKQIESDKEANLKEKYQIVEELKELINCKESLNDTFQIFRNLQKRWHDVGMIPQQNVKELWDLYHHHVENFYDYIKINKELRDLDLKKNLKHKTQLCEKAEELVESDSILEAAKELQTLHDQWREIGPVPREEKEPIWERFKAATEKINKRNYDFFTNLKAEQQEHLKVKLEIIEKAEEIAEKEFDSHKGWNSATKALLELQDRWKQTGAAPKKERNRIYKRFRAACDKFFETKRDFYLKLKDIQIKNLELKEKLCEKAEQIQDSRDWKSTTDRLIALQKEWKAVGPVPRKHSDKIWKRFRSACDKFFDAKSNFFSNVDEEQEKNMELKKELIQKVKNFVPGDNEDATIDTLKEFQNEWAEIGFVPIKHKNELQDEFRSALNDQFDKLKMDDFDKNLERYKAKIDSFLHAEKTEQKIFQERDKIMNKIKQLETNIITWENNIGFFSESSTTNKLKKDLEIKMEHAKKKLNLLKEKLHIIDNLL